MRVFREIAELLPFLQYEADKAKEILDSIQPVYDYGIQLKSQMDQLEEAFIQT